MTLRYTRLIVTGLALLTGLTACSTQQRHTLLTVFFEGIPPLEGAAPPPVIPSRSTNAVNTVTNRGPRVPAGAVQLLPHAPYRQRKCDTCHSPEQPKSMKGPQRDICYPCHTNVLAKAQVQHFPARKWKCLSCHQPHLATEVKLLRKPVVELCYQCHDPLNGKRYVHDPVKKGLCMACHTAHQSPGPNLLRKTGDPLCLGCHKPAAMRAAAGHVGIGDKKCLQCHDAHQSDKKGRLK